MGEARGVYMKNVNSESMIFGLSTDSVQSTGKVAATTDFFQAVEHRSRAGANVQMDDRESRGAARAQRLNGYS